MAKIFVFSCLALALVGTVAANARPQDAGVHQILDIETPQIFSYNQPLKQPDSLRNRQYFDFLSTLYRHDSGKRDLFRPYQRTVRDVTNSGQQAEEHRAKRAIVFRPLFVYQQQQIKKEKYQKRRRI